MYLTMCHFAGMIYEVMLSLALVVLKDKVSVLGPGLGLEGLVLGPSLGLEP